MAGELGNFCHVDCANQGVCDFKTGTCQCFEGQYGTDCSLQMEIPVKFYYSSDGIYGAPDVASDGQLGGNGVEDGFDFNRDWVESF